MCRRRANRKRAFKLVYATSVPTVRVLGGGPCAILVNQNKSQFSRPWQHIRHRRSIAWSA